MSALAPQLQKRYRHGMRTSLLGIVLFVVACGNNGGQGNSMDMSPQPVPTNFASINSEIFQPSCTFSTCHGMDSTTVNSLNMLDPQGTSTPGLKAYMALVNQPSVNAKAKSMGLARVKPCDAAHSFLQTKIQMTTDLDKTSDFGHHMPDLAGEFLSPAQQQAIKDWINRGALMNEPSGVSGSTCSVD
jgi:hypothetical protein